MCSNIPHFHIDTGHRRDTGHLTPFTFTLNLLPQVLDNIPGKSRTMLHLIKVFRGQADQTIKRAGHENVRGFGTGKQYDRNLLEKLMQKMVMAGLVEERSETNRSGEWWS